MSLKRTLAVLLCAVMALCVAALPEKALAAGGAAIQLGMGGLKANDRVYFGKYTENSDVHYVPWVVRSVDTTASSAFLLSEYLLGNSEFRTTNDPGDYSGSALQGAMTNILNGFDSRERDAVKPTNLTDVPVTAAHLFPLSKGEAAAIGWKDSLLQAKYINAAADDAAAIWWLRTRDDAVTYDRVGADGDLSQGINYNYPYGVRPAMNLDTSKVLFISAAGGKASSGALAAVGTNTNATAGWKLTLKDADHSGFSVTQTALLSTSTTIKYAGAKTGTNEHISAMLVDGSGNVLYYGQLKNITTSADSSGTLSITIPAGLSVDSCTLKIFNEQCNGDQKTDYASALLNVPLSAPAPSSGGSSISEDYMIIRGQNGVWPRGSAAGLAFAANGDYGKFLNVWVDGAYVSGNNYTARAGSTIIEFKPEYLATLSAGRHVLRVNYIDGYAETSFTVGEAMVELPKTGDSPLLGLCAGMLLVAGLIRAVPAALAFPYRGTACRIPPRRPRR